MNTDSLHIEFEQIVNGHQRPLYRFALQMVRNPEDAEEVVQDAFVRAYRALTSISPDERDRLTLKPWLYVITRNVALNRLRRKHPQFVSLDAMVDPDSFVSRHSGDRTHESYMERREYRELIALAISEMPEHLRPSATLRFLHGLTHPEIAEQVGRPLGTVKSHVYRAALRMRRYLRPELSAA